MSSGDETTRLLNTDAREDAGIPLQDWEDYKIESLLGEGGMARVFKAFDPRLKRYVALKFIRSDDENFKKRLIREARAQAQIEHDNVCKIYEVGEVQGKSYIAMQLIAGETLQALASELSLDQKILMMNQVCEAVHAAHKLGIVHRDIKPSNIMIERRDDGSLRPYVMDFGIARELTDTGTTATNAVMGTPAFMAPEQVFGDHRAIDRRTDIFSLGATLYYIICGLRPFSGSGADVLIKVVSQDPRPLKRLVPSLPEDVDVIVTKCMEKDPNRRYESARALADDLNCYLEGEPITARRATWSYRLLKKIKKNKTVATILLIASLVTVALAGFAILSYLRTSRQVSIARQLSQSVEAMDWMMRVAYMAPLHDIRRERGQVFVRMGEIKNLMNAAGKAGLGPGNFALGRGFLALQDYDRAREHLELAWNAGYQGKDVANALGLTLGALYKTKLSEVDRITDAGTRKLRLEKVEKEYRDPAIQYLKQGADSANQSREYGEALLSYYEQKWDNTLRLARLSSDKNPWLYEAKMLEGDVYSRLGEQAFQEGKLEEAGRHFDAGAHGYAQAEETSRSDPALYEAECSLWRAVMEVQFGGGSDGKDAYQKSNVACNKALKANSDSAVAYGNAAQTAWRWGENQFELGEDPSEAFRSSIELSRKAQALNPDFANAYYTMGTAYGYMADYELRTGKDPTESLNRSIKALNIAVEKDPGSAPAFTNLGVSYFSQGAQAQAAGKECKSFFQNAIDAYLKALKVSPKHLAARANIANAFENMATDAMNRGVDPMPYFRQSIENYEEALKINPNHWLIHTNLSSLYVLQIRYELDHGKDISGSYSKIISESEISTKLRPDNAYSAINSADAYLTFAEFKASKGENPLELAQKADAILLSARETDIPEVFLGLADEKRIEAEYMLRNHQDPGVALNAAKTYLIKAQKINAEEVLVPLGQARLLLLLASWQILHRQSPESALQSAEEQSNLALKLNPRAAEAHVILAQVALKRHDWKSIRKEPSDAELASGLASIEKSMNVNADIAEAYTSRAQLLLAQASAAPDPATVARLARDAAKDFERAFEINPNLQIANKDDFAKAKSLARL